MQVSINMSYFQWPKASTQHIQSCCFYDSLWSLLRAQTYCTSPSPHRVYILEPYALSASMFESKQPSHSNTVCGLAAGPDFYFETSQRIQYKWMFSPQQTPANQEMAYFLSSFKVADDLNRREDLRKGLRTLCPHTSFVIPVHICLWPVSSCDLTVLTIDH